MRRGRSRRSCGTDAPDTLHRALGPGGGIGSRIRKTPPRWGSAKDCGRSVSSPHPLPSDESDDDKAGEHQRIVFGFGDWRGHTTIKRCVRQSLRNVMNVYCHTLRRKADGGNRLGAAVEIEQAEVMGSFQAEHEGAVDSERRTPKYPWRPSDSIGRAVPRRVGRVSSISQHPRTEAIDDRLDRRAIRSISGGVAHPRSTAAGEARVRHGRRERRSVAIFSRQTERIDRRGNDT